MSEERATDKEPTEFETVIKWTITFADRSRITITVDAPATEDETTRHDQASDIYYEHLIDRLGLIDTLSRPGQGSALANPTRPPTDREVVSYAVALLNAGFSASAVPALLVEEFLISADRAQELIESAQRKRSRQARLDTQQIEKPGQGNP